MSVGLLVGPLFYDRIVRKIRRAIHASSRIDTVSCDKAAPALFCMSLSSAEAEGNADFPPLSSIFHVLNIRPCNIQQERRKM